MNHSSPPSPNANLPRAFICPRWVKVCVAVPHCQRLHRAEGRKGAGLKHRDTELIRSGPLREHHHWECMIMILEMGGEEESWEGVASKVPLSNSLRSRQPLPQTISCGHY
eukprot:gene11454-biopygen3578